MDEADQAQALEELMREHALQNHKNQIERSRLSPVGYCRYCTEPFDKGDTRVFCDHECKGEYAIFGPA